MEHALHLSSQHFVKASAPAPGQAILERVQQVLDHALDNEDDEEGVFLEELEEEMREAGMEFEEEDDDDDDPIPDLEEVAVLFKPTDIIGKAMALVKQVRVITLDIETCLIYS